MSGWVEWLRTAPWLTRERVVAYAWMMLAANAAASAFLLATSHDLLDFIGKPLGGDFLAFWGAGSLAVKGHAADAYDWALHTAEQAAAVPGAPLFYFPWMYPPIYQLVMAPLGALPYGWALFGWLALTGAAYVAVVRRWAPDRATPLLAVASPGFFANLMRGQNGLLSGALLGGGLLLLESRPLAAGALFGALSFKPQLGLLLPVALAAGGHWRAFAAAGVAVAALVVATVLLFGADVWTAFEASRHGSQQLLEGREGAYYAKVAVFSAVRQLGGTVALAWVAQGAASLAAAGIVARVWRSRAALAGKGAVLATAVLLATPWANCYDLAILALPVGWLAREAQAAGWRPWEGTLLATVALLPVLSIALAASTGLQVAPLVEAALLALIVRRLREAPVTPAAGAPA